MARVTVQDCLKNPGIRDHFELSVLASNRAKDIMSGAPLTLETNNDKSPVIALREIALNTLDCEALRTKLSKRFQILDSSIVTLEEECIEFDIADEMSTIDGDKLDEDNDDIAYSYEEENFSDNIDDLDDDRFTKTTF
jgi:DNA-directed RNA polymerase subunit omega